MRRFPTPWLALVLVTACTQPEGVEPGECIDNLDNDADGLYDCADDDCAGSPDCDEADADTDADADSDADADADADTDSDTDTWPAVEITEITSQADAATWFYEVRMAGWAEDAVLTITQDTSSPWGEEHHFWQGDYDPHGQWDSWYMELAITDDWQAQDSGTSTLFGNLTSCPNPDCEATMVWRVEAFEHGYVADCVVWAGDDADSALLMESGCREIELSGGVWP